MQEYDIALKLLLRQPGSVAMRDLAGIAVEKWLDAELPKVQNTRMDLLGETAEGGIVHLELQSGNDPAMALRMLEYCAGVIRICGRLPHQVLVYVGEPPLRMACELSGRDLWFRYSAIDIRDLDGERLLKSERIGDNVIAILARLQDQRGAVRIILARIASLTGTEREVAMGQLLILAGLRRLEETVEQESRKMPILDDIMDHKVLGREYKRGLREGVQEGELAIVRRLLQKRFGAIPGWAEEKLATQNREQLEEMSDRVLDAPTLEEVFVSQ